MLGKVGISALSLLPAHNMIWREALSLFEPEFVPLLKRRTNVTYCTGHCCEDQKRSCITRWFVNDKDCIILVTITPKYGLKIRE